VVAPRHLSNFLKAIFTDEASRNRATEKANSNNIPTTIINPQAQDNQDDHTIIIKEIPLGTSKEEIRATFEEYGTIEDIKWSLVGMWQKARIIYTTSQMTNQFQTQWSTLIGKDSVRIMAA